MLGLAIHTTSPQLGLALQGTAPDGQLVARQQVWDLGREVSSHLHVKMMEFVTPYSWQDLNFIAVAKGPGGFTGTRMGVVAARTLAQQLEVPLFGISSLAALAADAITKDAITKDSVGDGEAPPSRSVATGVREESTPSPSPPDIAVTMAAKRAAVYGAIYRIQADNQLTPVKPEAVIPEADWQATLENWPQPVHSIKVEAGSGIADSVGGVMKLALAAWQRGDRPEWSSVMPFYGQHPVQL